MKLNLAYGKKGMRFSLPDNADITVIEPKFTERLPDPIKALSESLQHPIGKPPLTEWLNPVLGKGSEKIGIAFSDITRPTPNHIILPVLLDTLSHVPDDRILLFNGTGTHRPNTEDELREMLGEEILSRFKIIQNDAADRSSHILVGRTGSGNDIWIHRDFVDCDARILTGFIEPHFFAGFSGGGKAVMPGLALLETVYRNHNAQYIDHPSVTWGVTLGNPLWEEVQEAAEMAGPSFLLNVTLNRDRQITGVFAGDPRNAHETGCSFVKKNAMAPVSDTFDIVITSNSGYPLDLNLYQSVKGMSAAAQIVREGGSIIIAADCWDGIPDHGEYSKLLREADSLESLLRRVRSPGFLHQDMWQAQVHAQICLKAEVHVYSSNLTDEQIEGAFLKPCRSIEETVFQLLVRYGKNARICVLPEGPQTIPYIKQRQGA